MTHLGGVNIQSGLFKGQLTQCQKTALDYGRAVREDDCDEDIIDRGLVKG